MKRMFLVILILCIAGSGVLMAQTSNLGAFNLVLADNFEYGDNYLGHVNARNLMNGRQINAGENYTLKVTFTVSRDLEDTLMFVFVDTTPAANYWDELSGYDGSIIDGPIKAGQTYSATLTFKTTKKSTAESAVANALIVMADGAGTKGRKGSGVKGPVTVRFTEFVLTKN